MFNDSRDGTGIGGMRKRTRRAVRLLQALALAAVLVLLGDAASEAATINCITGAGCSTYSNFGEQTIVVPHYGRFTSGGLQSNTWVFRAPGSEIPIYSFTISGTPTSTFMLDVWDVVVPIFSFNYPPLGGTDPNLTCVPTFNADNLCGFFNVAQASDIGPAWLDGYRVTILWNDQTPSLDPRITILQTEAPGQVVPYGFAAATMLTEIRYAPYLAPPDPGIGERGNEFSMFGVFEGPLLGDATVVYTKAELDPALVPEPASLLLRGTGLAGLPVRARRRKK